MEGVFSFGNGVAPASVGVEGVEILGRITKSSTEFEVFGGMKTIKHLQQDN
jgi:hypothetical protein